MTSLLIKLITKKNDLSEANARNSAGAKAGIVGIFFNLLLSAVKIIIGSLTASISIVADGLNNLSDIGSSVFTMIGFKLSDKPADSEHPYGHGRMEYLSAFIVSMLIMLVGFELLKESVTAIIQNTPAPKYTLWAIILLIFSVIIKFWMFLFNRKLGKLIGSESLFATAQDCINDSITTSVILISVIISKIFTLPFNLDAYMGVAVAIFILYSGISSAKQTIGTLLGKPPSQELIENIKNSVLSFEGFLGIHDLIIHNYGPNREFASVHVEVPQDIDIVTCHERIDTCEKLVKEKLGVELVIHMDPIETDNEEINSAKETISTFLKNIHPDLSVHDFRMTPKSDTHINFIFDVVVPNSLKMSDDSLRKEINTAAKQINSGYSCVVTFDKSYL